MKDTAELFASVDALKARLDAHRPLPADIVSQIRQDMRIPLHLPLQCHRGKHAHHERNQGCAGGRHHHRRQEP